MYKTKFQEFCQKKRINLPEYKTQKEGLSHCPLFKTVVNVNGLSFTQSSFSKNTKESQNEAAKVAFEYFTADTDAAPSVDSPSFGRTTLTVKDDGRFKEMSHLYKNQLLVYAQKNNLALPVYTSESEGPPNVIRFKSKVGLGDKVYESPQHFGTVKEAENAAAKVALTAVSPNGIEECLQGDSGFYKSVLQGFVQREYSTLPKYTTIQSDGSHVARFVSTVEVNGQTFRGDEAKSKKQAEANAAKVAYTALKEGRDRPGLEAHSVKFDVVKPLKLLDPISTSQNNQAVPEDATKVIFESNEPELLVGEKDTKSSSLQNPLLADSLFKEDSYAIAASEEALSFEKVSVSEPTAPIARRKVICTPFKAGMGLPPGAVLRHCDGNFISYELKDEF